MFKGMKRVVSLTLAMVLTLSLVSGCGGKNESYRTIAVSETNGTTTITRSAKDVFDAYEGVHLLSGDDAKVSKASDMTMELDGDKHVYAEENTHFSLSAAGKEGSTKTVINLEDGSVLVRIDNKLGEEENFDVDTPNSTMSVRGTVFRVSVDNNGNQVCTTIQTYEGTVEAQVKDEKGKLTGESFMVEAGEEAAVLTNEDGSISWTEKTVVAYKELPGGTKDKLKGFADKGATLTYSDSISMAEALENAKHWKQISYYDPEYVSNVEFDENGVVIKRNYGDSYYDVYTYNDNYVLLKMESFNNYDGEWELSGSYTYNEQGSVLEEYMSYDEWYTTYSYYADGTTLKSSETYVNLRVAFNDDSLPDGREFFERSEYNEHGDMVHEDTYLFLYNLRNDRELYSYDYYYEYDSNGKILMKNDGWETHYYEYDEHGNLVYSYVIDNETGEKEYWDELTYVYEFIAGEYRAVYERETYNEEGNGYYERKNKYDENGLIIETEQTSAYVDSDGNPWDDDAVYYSTIYHEYDEYGNETLWMMEETGAYAYTERCDYSYDPAVFPAGKPGDIFTRTKYIKEQYGESAYDSTAVVVYIYVE